MRMQYTAFVLGSFFAEKRWYWLVFCTAAFFGLLVSMPHILHVLDGRYQGIPVHFNSDEFSYLPRVQEALLGRSHRLGTAVTGGDEELPELQTAFIERVYGELFRPFRVNAATVLMWMDFIIPFLLFLVLLGFCRACGFSRKQAFVIAVLFCFMELYNLGRPIHQRTSFLLTLLAMWGVLAGLQYRLLWGVMGGALMGLLVDVYFWSWTAAWAWWGILTLLYFLNAVHSRAERWKHVWRILLFGGVGAVIAVPIFLQLMRASAHSLYTEAFFRSGIGHTQSPESWPWTVLFLCMALGVSVGWCRRIYTTAVTCTVLTAFVIFNQHLLHGIRFIFVSHYLFFLVFAACVAVTAAARRREWFSRVVLCAGCVFLFGIAYDNRAVIAQWRIDDTDFGEQHLASLLSLLEAFDQSVVLSDPLTSSLVASHTRHDVLYTHYIQHELRSHRELAERYCLTQMPLDVPDRRPEDEVVLVYGDAYDAIFDMQGKERVRQDELDLVTGTCADIEERLEEYLERYRVKYVVWDEKRQPGWDMRRLGTVELVEQGEGWSVWVHDTENR